MRRLLLLTLCAACAGPAPRETPGPVVQGPRASIEPPLQAAPSPIQPQRLRIIGTNDFHGALDPRPDETEAMRGGAANVAAAIRKAEQECRQPECVTILLDGGDMFQGSAASNFVFGRSVVGLFNYLGYSAAALGNHEFDWGQDTLRALMRAARYPILGANVRYKDGRDVPWIPNDTIVHRGPFRVGIIGLSTVETPVTTTQAHVADLLFADPVPIVDSIAPALRARGADFVVIIGHVGARCAAACTGEAIDIASRITAKVDAVVSGHSHTRVDTEVKGMPVVQARSRGLAIDVVDLYTSGAPATREIREVYADSLRPDTDAANIVVEANRYLDLVAPQVNRPVARIATTMRTSGAQHAVGNLIADAMRVVGGGDLAVMNSGGVRAPLRAGPATYGTLFEVQPFGNRLVRVRVRGSDLRAYFARALERGSPNFHVSGARIVYHGGATPGLDSLTVLGRPVTDQAIYTVVLNDFSANGGDRLGFGTAAVSTVPANIVDLDALIAYLSSLPQPIVPPAGERVIRRP
ncbi:MAG TPA: 5'-nucleotidase C-terminal domain-containing protein [Gemmatimonadaceae bacterium]|nr:5'-nucleotidase C-terminal domain-containing protein [Gemmatimonadaceae bacterium]